MALTEEQIEDKIEISGKFRHVQVRTATVIYRDGEEISRSYHRHVVAPDDDTTGQSALVRGICREVHTPQIKNDFAAHKAAQALIEAIPQEVQEP